MPSHSAMPGLIYVPASDIDFAFFIASVDLWSADGEREVNLVLHPSSADRYIPATQVTKRRRATNSTPPAQPIPSTSAFSAQPQGPEPAPTTTSFAAFSSQSFSFGPDQTSPFSFGQNATLFATSDLPPTDHSSPSFLSGKGHSISKDFLQLTQTRSQLILPGTTLRVDLFICPSEDGQPTLRTTSASAALATLLLRRSTTTASTRGWLTLGHCLVV